MVILTNDTIILTPEIDYHCHSSERHQFDSVSWILGLFLGTLAPFMSSLGMNIQRYAYKKHDNLSREPIKNWNRFHKYWTVGFICITGASITDFPAFTFSPKVIISALGSLSIVFNIPISYYINGEKTNSWARFYMFVILVGCLLTVTFSNHVNEVCDRKHLYRLFTRDVALIYMVIHSILMTGCYLLIDAFNSMQEAAQIPSQQYKTVDMKEKKYEVRIPEDTKISIKDVDTGEDLIFDEDELNMIKKVMEEDAEIEYNKYKKWRRLHMALFPLMAALFGSPIVISFGSIGALLLTAARGEDPELFINPEIYMLTIFSITFMVGQIIFMNKALKRFDNKFVQPLFVSSWIVFVTLLAGCITGEFDSLEPQQIALIPVGNAIIIIGNYLLVKCY